MVVGVVRNVAAAIGFLDAADAVLKSGGAGDRPRAGEGLGIPQVGPELLAIGTVVIALGGEVRIDRRQLTHIGKTPRLRPVGEVTIGENKHRRAVLDGDAGGLDGSEEAIRRRLRCHDWHG